MKKLGIVVIGRNSSNTLPRVFDRLNNILSNNLKNDYSILYVDSSSEDESVEIALNKGVDVIQIASGEWRCAAAGRNIGLSHINTEFLLFLDGDMLLDSRWIKFAISYLKFNPNVALVSGERIDTDIEEEVIQIVKQRVSAATVSDRFSGSCIVRRNIINDIGGFDSFLISNEEKDLCDRVILKGFEIHILPHAMVTHLGPNLDFQERLRRGAMGYYRGIGQYTRKLLSRKQYFKAFRKIRSQIVFILIIIFSIFLIYINKLDFLVIGLFVGFIAIIYRFRNLKRGFLFLISQPLIINGLIRGLFDYKKSSEYNPKLNYFTAKK